jgi:D-hydroxyproline dehydrogenase subunit alpha
VTGPEYEVVIVGAGPAGISAACVVAETGRDALLIDDNPSPGGQIWREQERHGSNWEAAHWLRRLQLYRVEVLRGATVIDGDPDKHAIVCETANSVSTIRYKKLILATGSRELFLPFPGWTLPNVMGAGGLQALVKAGMPISGKRVVVAGSGPLLLAVGAYLKKQGAHVLAIAEQASWARLARFGLGLPTQPYKLAEAVQLKRALFRVPYHAGAWVEAALGETVLERVRLSLSHRRWDAPCDYLAVGFGLVPNIELAATLGCKLSAGCVQVDPMQQTSASDILSAGETTGIGGVELSLMEGRIAGYSAIGDRLNAQWLFSDRERMRRFARRMQKAFALREELRHLPSEGTLVCRCEDVSYQRIAPMPGWRAAKLHTRCGMGPCQGRVCGPAVEFLFGWHCQSTRAPVFPARIDSLIGHTEK